MTKIKPCGYRVIIKPDPIEEVTKGGIVLALDERRERAGQMFGTIVRIGPEAWKDYEEGWAKEGDRVMYSMYSGKTIKDTDTDENYLIINDEDVIAIVPKTTEDSRIDGEVTF